jgi:hypothetical protein
MDYPGFISWQKWNNFYPNYPNRLWRPTKVPISRYKAFPLVVTRLQREANHLQTLSMRVLHRVRSSASPKNTTSVNILCPQPNDSLRWNGAVGNLHGNKQNERVVKCRWLKCSEGLSNRVPINIRRYIDHMKFDACVPLPFISLFHFLLVMFCNAVYIAVCSVCFCLIV